MFNGICVHVVCLPCSPPGPHYDLRNAHQASIFTNSTWAQLLLSLSKSFWSQKLVLSNELLLLMNSLETYFSCLENSPSRITILLQNFQRTYWLKLLSGWKITMSEAHSLEQWPEVRPFELSGMAETVTSTSLYVGPLRARELSSLLNLEDHWMAMM